MVDDPAERLAALVRATALATEGRAPSGTTHDEADAVAGTIATDDALGFDPRALLGACHDAGARVVVIGQVAGWLHGSTEPTGDLDLLWSGDAQTAEPLAAAFESVGATLGDDAGGPVRCVPATFATRPKLVFRTPLAAGDLCTPSLPWGGIDASAVLARAVAVDVGGFTIHVATLADLVAMRRAVGRPKDRRRADELERPRRPG